MPTAERSPRQRCDPLTCGVIAGPLFAGAFTAIGATRDGYDWQRFPVSSLAIGHRGWLQRANFVVAGALYACAARGLARCPERRVGPRAVPVLVAGVGIGLVGSGVFVTDPVGGFPPRTPDENGSHDPDTTGTAPTREGLLHNLCAVPIFVGIPIAGLASAATAVRSGDYRWACYSAGSSLMMVASFFIFGRAFGGASGLAGKGGIFQRISIASGFGWLTVLSLRARSSLPVLE
ncbi:MAG TPA: DUF998 domain-containing protein [Acidimicrobiales bacterium]|nr:DUF998 domain-containing protein [Acidimicrobiales bacterium]